MRSRNKPRLLSACLVVCSFLWPVVGSMQTVRADENDLTYDSRIEGYGRGAALDTGTSLYYMLFGGLAVFGLAVLFKDAKRSHLD